MAGKSTRRGSGGKQRTAKPQGARGRKPAVPPIIELEATEVGASERAAKPDEASPDREPAAQAVGAEPDEASTKPKEAGAGPREPGPEPHATHAGADDPDKPWMERMKAFLLSGVHVGGLRVPAAGLLVLIGLFGAGLAIGRYALPELAPMSAERGPDAVEQRLETALGDVAASTSALQARLEQLEGKLDAASNHAKSAETAAGAALGEVRKVDAAVKSLAAQPAANTDAPNEALTALQAQVTDLAAKIDRLTPSADGEQGLSAAAEKRIDEIAQAVAALKTAVEASSTQAAETPTVDVDAIARTASEDVNAALETLEAKLQQRFKALEDKLAVAPAAGSGATPRAVVALERAAASGAGFTGELDAVARLLPQDPALPLLRPHATTGVWTRDALAAGLTRLAADLGKSDPAAADAPAEKSSGVISGFMDKVNNLVEIRKVDTADHAALRRAVESAKPLVASGDLGRAADVLEVALKGNLQKVKSAPLAGARIWVMRARARVETDAALAALTRRALQGVAAEENGAG